MGVSSPVTHDQAIAAFDYGASAELFLGRSRRKMRSPRSYWRFGNAAEAVCFAVERLEASDLLGAILEVDEGRFDGPSIRQLYDAPDYPLRATSPAGLS